MNEKEAGPGEQVDTLPISLPNYNMQQISFDASTISLLQLRNRVHKTAVLPRGTLLILCLIVVVFRQFRTGRCIQ